MPNWNYGSTRYWRRLYSAQNTISGHPLHGQIVMYSREYWQARGPQADGTFPAWHVMYWRGLTEDYRWNSGLERPQSFLPIPTSARIVFIGSGFGFMAEAARSLGWANLACVDDSDWIHARKNDPAWRYDGNTWVQDAVQASETILQAPLSSTQSIKNHCKTVWGGQGEADYVITEFVLSSLPDPTDQDYDPDGGETDELGPALVDCDALLATGGTVVHLVSALPYVRPPFNVKTLAEWRAVIDVNHPGHRLAPAAYSREWQVL